MGELKKVSAFGSGMSKKEKRRVVNQTEEKIEKIEGLDQNTPVFGIDLGTTNSAISVVVSGDRPTSIPLTNGRMTMPSCVMWHNGEFIVGQEAYEHREQANVIYSVKRYMQDPNKMVTFNDGGKKLKMSPAEVSAKILRGLVDQTGGMFGDIKDVVVTVPAYFDQNGRNATRKACELAGLNLIDIINEPTAASLCMDDSVCGGGSHDFIVFDFGGGTLDITLGSITKNEIDEDMIAMYGITEEEKESSGVIIQCKAIEGDSHLGGDNIDLELLEIVGAKIEEKFGVKLNEIDRTYREGMLLRLEQFKKKNVGSTFSMQIHTTSTKGVKVDGEVLITPKDFKASLEPVYRKCKRIFDKLLNKTANTAKLVLLVGGSTKNPILIERLKRDYPDFTFSPSLNPDLSVTNGAAVKGRIDKFGDVTTTIFDILPISIGIVGEGGRVHRVISSGELLPVSKTMTFTNVVDGQKEMSLKVVQGESSRFENCVLLGELLFTDLPDVKEGEADLAAEITVNAKSVMTCKGYIDGKEKELQLSLTGETEKTRDANSKLQNRMMRLRESAKKLSARDRKVIEEMLDACPETYSVFEIGRKIKELSSK